MGQSTPIGGNTDVPHEGTNKDGRTWKLSGRERQILSLIVDGHTNKAIAQMLEISPRTVEAHRSKIMAKIGAHNSAQLVFKLLGM